MERNPKQRKIKNDIILTASILIVAVVVFVAVLFVSQKGGYVEVKKDGEIIGKYPLSTNVTVEISGSIGYNLLMIEDGEAYIKSADCPDKLCVKRGKIDKNGETAVCLPNKVTVTVIGGKEGKSDF